MFSKTISSIPISYNTHSHNINFDLIFGEGKDGADCKNETDRKNFSTSYDIEVYENKTDEDYMKGYRVVAKEGPLVIRLDNITINSNNTSNYDYAIGFALDNNEPHYSNNWETIPNNIERDGTLWTIPANTNTYYNFDQNPKGKYQWVSKRALELNYEPSQEENVLGMEKTTEKTGLIYLTFMVFHKNKVITQLVCEGITRGGGATRGGTPQNSSAARFGYGNETESASSKSNFKFVNGTEKYVLPIRLRIAENSSTTNINCAQTLECASINSLRKQTMTIPF